MKLNTVIAIPICGLLAIAITQARDFRDPDKTPPNFKLTWPEDDISLSGSRFNAYGRCNDKAAKVTAFLCNDTGKSTVAEGFVERNGCLWVEGLPISEGKNHLTIVASDSSQNSSFTNLVLFGSSVVLTIDPVANPGQLWESSTTITGYCSDTNSSICVNGVKAEMNPDGRWKAVNVPGRSPNGGGVASFNVLAENDAAPPRPANCWLPTVCSPAITGDSLCAGISLAPINTNEYYHYPVSLGLTNCSGGDLLASWVLPKEDLRYQLRLFDETNRLVGQWGTFNTNGTTLPVNLNIHRMGKQELAHVDGMISFTTNSTVRIASFNLDQRLRLPPPGEYHLEVGMRMFKIAPNGRLMPFEFPVITAPLKIVDQPNELIFRLNNWEREGKLAWSSGWNSLRVGVLRETNKSGEIRIYLRNYGANDFGSPSLLLPKLGEQYEFALFDMNGGEVPKTPLGLQQGLPLSHDDKPFPNSRIRFGGFSSGGGTLRGNDAPLPISIARGDAIECGRFRLLDCFLIKDLGTYRLTLKQRLYQWDGSSALAGVVLPEVTLPIQIGQTPR